MNILVFTLNIIFCAKSLDRIYEEVEPKTLNDIYDNIETLCRNQMERIQKLEGEVIKKFSVLQCADVIDSRGVRDLLSSFVEENEYKISAVRVCLKSNEFTAEKSILFFDEVVKAIHKWQEYPEKVIPTIQNREFLENIEFFDSPPTTDYKKKVRVLSRFVSKIYFQAVSDYASSIEERTRNYFIVFSGKLRKMEIFALREILNFMSKMTIFADKKIFIFINDSLQTAVEKHFQTFSKTPAFLDSFYSFHTIQLNDYATNTCPLADNEEAFDQRDVYIIGLNQLKIYDDISKCKQDSKKINFKFINSKSEIHKKVIFRYKLKWLNRFSMNDLPNTSSLLRFDVYTTLQRGLTISVIYEIVKSDSKKICIYYFDSVNVKKNFFLYVLVNSNQEITQINNKNCMEGQVILLNFRKKIDKYIQNLLLNE